MDMDFANRRCSVSVTNAIGAALSYAYKVFFQPFSFVKWLKFGVVLLLVNLGQGGSFNFNMPFDSSKSEPPAQLMEFGRWCESHLAAVIAIVAAILLVVLAIWIIFIYFSSRFNFIFLDGVVNNDMRIKEYYQANRANGWSFFLWQLGWGLVALLTALISLVPAGLVIYYIVKNSWTGRLIVGLIASILFFFAVIFGLIIVTVLTHDFVLPIMSLLKIRVLEAWGVLWKLIRSDTRTFIYYLLLKFCLGLASIFIMIVPCCVVGVIFALPALMLFGLAVLAFKVSAWLFIVIIPAGIIILALSSWLYNSVFAPVSVFFRSYSLLVLEGFGDEFKSINRTSVV